MKDSNHLTSSTGLLIEAAAGDRLLVSVMGASLAEDSINILIVDDEPKNLTVLETVLDDPAYRLVRANSADEALMALLHQEFALLILDIRMPGITGFELAQIVKERKKTASVPIIFLTAYYSEDQHVLAGYGSGAVDYLHKPVNAAILRSKVAIFAELHRKQREIVRANSALFAEVSERSRAQEQLRQLNIELEQRVAERTAALRESRARLLHAADAARLTYIEIDYEAGRMRTAHNYAEVMGYAPPREHGSDIESGLRVLLEPVLLPDRARVEDAIRNFLDGTRLEKIQFRVCGDDGTERSIESLWAAESRPDGTPLRVFVTNLDVTERQRAADDNRLLMAEVNHRAKNLLAVVQAVARLTARSGDPATFIDRLSERLAGISASQDLLIKNLWQGIEVAELVEAQLAHLKDVMGARLVLQGPAACLTPAAAQGIGMALHELATNAVKYGALSGASGRVQVSWQLDESADPTFTLRWVEEGGPKVSPPTAKGFGHMVIGPMAESAVVGTTEINFGESGMTWTLSAAAADTLKRRPVAPAL